MEYVIMLQSPSTDQDNWTVLANAFRICSLAPRILAMLADTSISTMQYPIFVKPFTQSPYFPPQRRPFFPQTILHLSEKLLRLLPHPKVRHRA